MSRLDSFIRRLEAQRACLDHAAALIAELPGPVLELGLGNGRTYDHLRHLLPQRAIYVCERRMAAHPACRPPGEFLLLGDMRQTLPAARPRLAERVALAHYDASGADAAANAALIADVAPLLVPLLCAGAIVVSEWAMTAAELAALPLPPGIAPGRYHLYRRISRQSPA